MSSSPQLKEIYDLYDQKVQLENHIKNIRKEIKQATSIMQMEELKCRKRVLRRFYDALILVLLFALSLNLPFLPPDLVSPPPLM